MRAAGLSSLRSMSSAALGKSASSPLWTSSEGPATNGGVLVIATGIRREAVRELATMVEVRT